MKITYALILAILMGSVSFANSKELATYKGDHENEMVKSNESTNAEYCPKCLEAMDSSKLNDLNRSPIVEAALGINSESSTKGSGQTK